MNRITIYEFDTLFVQGAKSDGLEVPQGVFSWLLDRCLRTASKGGEAWLKLTQRFGQQAIQVTNFVGVIRAPSGFQIEVLPKVGKVSSDDGRNARILLIEMLKCLTGFKHIQTESARLLATKMPLYEVFIRELLIAVQSVLKFGIRSDYRLKIENLPSLRGKLLISNQMKENLFRPNRFYTEYDDFTSNRPENRILHAAVKRALLISTLPINQTLAKELSFMLSDLPVSLDVEGDFQRIRLTRGMGYYEHALAWSKLILKERSPLTGDGKNSAPSLIFPMEALFEAYVEKHLRRQLDVHSVLRSQVRSNNLVDHIQQKWFQLRPDLLVQTPSKSVLVLDTKWKLIEQSRSNGSEKYGLAQSDFYQMYAYGQSYLAGSGDVILIYPKTDAFWKPLPPFHFPTAPNLRLWVLPFCLNSKRLIFPEDAQFSACFR